MKNVRRLLSILLALCVLITAMPVSVMAEPNNGPTVSKSGGSSIPTPIPTVFVPPDPTSVYISLPAPDVTIDYQNEELDISVSIEKLEGVPIGEIELVIDGGSVGKVFDIQASYKVSISGDMFGRSVDVYLKYEEITGDTTSKSIPMRPSNDFDASQLQYDATHNSATISGVGSGIDVGLSANDSAPGSFETASDGTVEFTGLTTDTTYNVFCRIAATDDAFASAWAKAGTVKTNSMPINTPAPDLPAPNAAIDYKNEVLRISVPDNLPEGIDVSELNMYVETKDNLNCLEDCFADANVYEEDITDEMFGLQIKFTLYHDTIGLGMYSAVLNIPARPENTLDASNLSYEVTNNLAVIGNIPAGFEVGLSTGNSAPSSFETVNSDGNVIFTGLTADTTYHVFYRIAATGDSFASEWAKANDITTSLAPIATALPATDVTIDYQNEKLHIVLPDNLPEGIETAKIGMAIINGSNSENLENCFANSNSYDKTITNEMFGTPIRICLTYDYILGNATQITIPTRPENDFDASKLTYDAQPLSVTISNVDDGVEVYVTAYDSMPEANETGKLPTDGKVEFGESDVNNMAPNSSFNVFYRIAATDNSFKSEWKKAGSVTTLKIPLTFTLEPSVFEWQENLALEESDIKESICLIDTVGNDHADVGIVYDNISVEVTNAKGDKIEFPIKDVGSYTAKIEINEDDFYEQYCYLANDTTTFNIVPPKSYDQPRIDYAGEMVIVSAEGVSDAELTFAVGGKTYKTQMTGGSYSIALDALGNMLDMTLPGDSDVYIDVTISSEGAEPGTYSLYVPRRPVVQEPDEIDVEEYRHDIYIEFYGAYSYEPGLKPASADGDEPTIFSEQGEGVPFRYGVSSTGFYGLTPGTEYVLYVRKPSGEFSFASDWLNLGTVQTKALEAILTVDTSESKYTWTSGFALSEYAIKNSVVFWDNGSSVDLETDCYDISVTDANGNKVTLPIRDIGTYTVEVELDYDTTDGDKYELNNNTFAIEVVSGEFSAQIDFINEAIIVRLPEEFEGDKDKLSLSFKMGDKGYTPQAQFASGNQYTVTLKTLSDEWGVTLPGTETVKLSIDIFENDVSIKEIELDVPRRIDTEPKQYIEYHVIYSEDFVIYGDFNKLEVYLDEREDTHTPSIKPQIYDGVCAFTGLEANNTYYLYARVKTDGSKFASDWYTMKFVIPECIYLEIVPKQLEAQWFPGFSLDEETILNNIYQAIDIEQGIAITDAHPSIAVTDAEGNTVELPITEPGTYTAKATLSEEDWTENKYVYKEGGDTFTIHIEPFPFGSTSIDFKKEQLIVSLYEGYVAERNGVMLQFYYGDEEYTAGNVFANSDTFVIDLSKLGEKLGITLPSDNSDQTYEISIVQWTSGAKSVSTDKTIPARPAFGIASTSLAGGSIGGVYIKVSDDASKYSAGIKKTSEGGDVPTTIVEESDEENYFRFENLPYNTDYDLYLCMKATAGSFRSAWSKIIKVTTKEPLYLNVSTNKPVYQWTPGFSLDEAAIRSSIKFIDADNGATKDVPNENYTIEVSKSGSKVELPITEPGSYTVKLVKTQDWDESFDLTSDRFDIVVTAQAGNAIIGYQNETLAVSLPEAMLRSMARGSLNCDITFSLDGRQYTVHDAFVDGYYSIALSELGEKLGATLPDDESGRKLHIMITASGVTGSSYDIVIPKRPDCSLTGSEQVNSEIGYTDILIMGVGGFDAGLSLEPSGAITLGTKVGKDIEFTGLSQSTEYCLHLRDEATNEKFASKWQLMDGTLVTMQQPQPPEAEMSVSMSDYTYGGDVPEPELINGDGQYAEWYYMGADGVEHSWINITGTTLPAGSYTMIARVGSETLMTGFAVMRAAAPAIQWPTAGSITYGQRLGEAKLSADADEHGSFAWASPDELLGMGSHMALITYTPYDAANYDYAGVALSREISVTVAGKDMGDDSITIVDIPNQTYTGKPIEPEVTVKDGDKLLTEGEDYTVSYTDNVDEGKATVIITGMGNYAGTVEVEFVIRDDSGDDDDEDDDGDKDDDGDDDEDDDGKTEVETLSPDEYADKLIDGEYVEGTLTDRDGMPQLYEVYTDEVQDENGEVIKRTLVISALPLMDENDEPLLREGEPVYEQRNLHLSGGLLDALEGREYTYIRFELNEAALEWAIADMAEDNNVVRIAPMENDELSRAERRAIGDAEQLTGSYRARITATIDGEETDVTNAVPSLTVAFAADSVRQLGQDETAKLLIVPGDGETEAMMSDVQLVKTPLAGSDEEYARYEAALNESGLFLIVLK